MNQVKFASNYIEGTAKTEGNELLVLSLPYSEGWSVQIDGKEANLLNVNTMWTGVYLKEQGVHKTLTLQNTRINIRCGNFQYYISFRKYYSDI